MHHTIFSTEHHLRDLGGDARVTLKLILEKFRLESFGMGQITMPDASEQLKNHRIL